MIDLHTRIKYSADVMYVLTISGCKEIMKFKETIGFPINSDKNKKFLNMLEKNYKTEVKRNKIGKTKDLIISAISEYPRSVKEISSILNFSKNMYKVSHKKITISK